MVNQSRPSRSQMAIQRSSFNNLMAGMPGLYFIGLLIFYIIDDFMTTVMLVLMVSTTIGFYFQSCSVNIGFYFYYPALVYHTITAAFAAASAIASLFLVITVEGSADRVLARIFQKLFDWEFIDNFEKEQHAWLQRQDITATTAIFCVIGAILIFFLINGLCLWVIVKACEEAKNKSQKVGYTRWLPMDNDSEANEVQTAANNAKMYQWSPEATRVYYGFWGALVYYVFELVHVRE